MSCEPNRKLRLAVSSLMGYSYFFFLNAFDDI